MSEQKKPQEHWKIKAEELIHDGSPWLQLFNQTVILPDGREVEDYYRLTLPNFTVVYATTDDHAVLTLRSYKHGLGEITHALPGGIVEPGEDPLKAAKRELLEETGYEAQNWQGLGSFTVNGNLCAGQGHYFKATNAWKVQESDPGDLEDMQVLKLSETELIAMVKANDFKLLNHASCITLAQLF